MAGLVLLSGYYFPSFRLDALMIAGYAIPVLGDILRYTVLPVFGWLTMPLTKRLMFAPSPMTDRFKVEYSTGMALRPSQIRATVVDGTMMVPSAATLRARYSELTMPVRIVAGSGDLVVRPRQAERLHATIKGSALRIVPGVGHMVHHVAIDEVSQAIEEVAGNSDNRTAIGDSSRRTPNQHAPGPSRAQAAAV
jgi:pimeloyl-ACP methyl ester carboxylesterase